MTDSSRYGGPLARLSKRSSGTVLLQDRWKISFDQVLGEGGFAVVYKGLDVQDCRNVAVKVYKAEAAGADVAKIHENFEKIVTVLQQVGTKKEAPSRQRWVRSGSFDMGA